MAFIKLMRGREHVKNALPLEIGSLDDGPADAGVPPCRLISQTLGQIVQCWIASSQSAAECGYILETVLETNQRRPAGSRSLIGSIRDARRLAKLCAARS
ncbi:hypothetical protein [Bradyrhizobium sp. NBAIM01]|uniref:hypothetical protein n=1 Tax=Bradyrhizobium sp. NBAIM01 TaxID=2793818 RepID=UPI001CD56EEF|nr:hypothetical protein [Bradyrhizobium sp. NBAIM01]MCA1515608.1 hypothetical protein [Bradyrhizobium sp. NBAIM01]